MHVLCSYKYLNPVLMYFYCNLLNLIKQCGITTFFSYLSKYFKKYIQQSE